MTDDPLVEEVRLAGQQYIESFDGDWKVIIADLDRRAREEGRHIVLPPEKRESTEPKPPPGPTKHSG